MKRIIPLALFSLMFLACNDQGNQHPSTQYEEKKASLADMERDSPLKFLKVTGDIHNNLLNQAVISGEITNKATLTGYRNIQVQVSFLDEAGKVIERQKNLLDNVVNPNSTDDFKIKTSHVKGANSISIEITDAAPIEKQ